jgi:hypothetical protein
VAKLRISLLFKPSGEGRLKNPEGIELSEKGCDLGVCYSYTFFEFPLSL